MISRPTTVKPAGPFGGNSQSGRTAQHGTQSGYVMHKRHDSTCPRVTGITTHDAMRVRHHKSHGHGLRPGQDSDINCEACQREDREMACACDREACQPCKDAHAAYGRALLLATVHDPRDVKCWHGATLSTCQHDTHNGERTRPADMP
jgi:hypothetical protein